ncbi:site-specific tyrosine recombinase XerD [Salinivirga cyanobacteriivorans]|uniref:Site-specific tyrosine recombinase XerD n=1 Tax=Salinivirga cyanobacteriivorans TaxID=1307839 RepID=A0A0S2HV15_9BACT|nr:site-specific integrase [Salinivirga cyanobacteriivorans]ALO13883.1 site-specific tyrosine recombinase XerD [Salinivirga cyanobacteriivorans]ALO13891.1 site-specific tyrosine recombinase XerD [Salinivirga cyanobacteriivorans]
MNPHFRKYLVEKNFAKSTAGDYSSFIEKRFKTYLYEFFPSTDVVEHETLMQYIRHRKAEGVSAKTINLELKKIGYYLEFKGLPNVAESVRLKGVQRTVPHDLFTQKQLDEMYQKFPESRNHWTHKNTLKTYHIILGLKIYQGLQTSELVKLEINHLQLDKGKIYVPSTRRTNKRILELKPFQILPLHEYLLTERKYLNEAIEGNYLFHKKRLIRGMPRIKAMINRYEPRLKNIAQIRASVITNWLQHYNLREVQYMAGHKYVSSTERYRTDNLEGLQKELEKYHPLK